MAKKFNGHRCERRNLTDLLLGVGPDGKRRPVPNAQARPKNYAVQPSRNKMYLGGDPTKKASLEQVRQGYGKLFRGLPRQIGSYMYMLPDEMRQQMLGAANTLSRDEIAAIQEGAQKLYDQGNQMQEDGKTGFAEGLRAFRDADLSSLKPLRKAAGYSKSELVDGAMKDFGVGERTAIKGLLTFKDFAYGGHVPQFNPGGPSAGGDPEMGRPDGMPVDFLTGPQLGMIRYLVNQGVSPQVAMAMASVTHKESKGLAIPENDYSGTSNDTIRGINSRFKRVFGDMSDEELDKLKADPVAFFNAAYGDIKGNTDPDDGYNFRGRGLIQLTGRANYAAASEALFGDDRLVQNPDLMLDPDIAGRTAGWFMMNANPKNNIGKYLDFDLGTTDLTDQQYQQILDGAYATIASGASLSASKANPTYLSENYGQYDVGMPKMQKWTQSHIAELPRIPLETFTGPTEAEKQQMMAFQEKVDKGAETYDYYNSPEVMQNLAPRVAPASSTAVAMPEVPDYTALNPGIAPMAPPDQGTISPQTAFKTPQSAGQTESGVLGALGSMLLPGIGGTLGSALGSLFYHGGGVRKMYLGQPTGEEEVDVSGVDPEVQRQILANQTLEKMRGLEADRRRFDYARQDVRAVPMNLQDSGDNGYEERAAREVAELKEKVAGQIAAEQRQAASKAAMPDLMNVAGGLLNTAFAGDNSIGAGAVRGLTSALPLASTLGPLGLLAGTGLGAIDAAFKKKMEEERPLLELNEQRLARMEAEPDRIDQFNEQAYADYAQYGNVNPLLYARFGGPMGEPDYETEGGEMIMASPDDPPVAMGQGRYKQESSNMYRIDGPSHEFGGVPTKGAMEPYVDAYGQQHESPYVFSDAPEMEIDPTEILKLLR